MTSAYAMRLFSPLLLALSLGAHAATFEVNSAGDQADANPGNGSCATAGNLCTLRAAIQEANATPGTAPHRILFADNVAAITLTSSLPAINVPIEINGNRASVNPASPRVDINGNGVNAGFQFNDSASQGFDPNPPAGAPRSGLFNLVVRNFSADGVSLSGRGFTVQNCYIGTTPDGQSASANQGNGISISSPIPSSPLPDLPGLGDLDLGDIDAVVAFLFTTLAALNAPSTIDGNLISGNGLDGVRIFGQHTAMVFVRGNRIGVSADGALNIPNASIGQGHGVQVLSSSFANFIGPFNLISGNSRADSGANGVFINTGNVRFPNFVAGNLIGPGGSIDPFNFDPTAPNVGDLLDFGNLENGLRLDTRRATTAPANPTPYSVVVGPANVISFNGSETPPIDNMNADPNAGVFITGNSADAYLLGNVIGGLRFEIAGNPQLLGGNKGDGIHVTTANHQIGGSSLAERNTIAGNGRNGITLRGGSTRNVVVQGNLIGRDFLNLLNFGQGGDGIRVDMANMLTLGGSADGAGNVIAASGRNGIKISNSSAWSNLISRNSLVGNATGGTGIGIDLDRTENAPDATSAPPVPANISNRGQTAPVICNGAAGEPPGCMGAMPPSYNIGTNQVSLTAVLDGLPNTDYVIESFLVDAPGSLGNGEGRLYMTSQTVSSDGDGQAMISVATNAPVGGGSGSLVTLTATNVSTQPLPDGSSGPANNTSEFSGAVPLRTPGTVSFNPSALGFGLVSIGSQADLSATLEHISGDTVTGISLGVSGAGFSLVSSTCGAEPFDLGPSETCQATLRFAPTLAGASSGSLTASPSFGTGDALSLTGNGQLPGSLAFADTSLDLGNVVVGANGTATTTLSNPGGAPISNILITVSGTGFSRQGGTCDSAAFTLPAAGACTVTIRFQPGAAGAASGQLNAIGVNGSASVSLAGTGLAPAALAFDQASYAFGAVTVGTAVQRTATLSNGGDVTASNILVNVSGTSYSRVGGTCDTAAFSLPAGNTCTIVLRFLPTADGSAMGTLSASGNGGLSAGAELLGNGLAAGALAWDPVLLAFGDIAVGGNSTLTATLTNTGGTPIDGILIAVSGTGFSRESGTCATVAFSLGAGIGCTVVVRFEPATAGSATGLLNATAADAASSAPLSGNGLGAAQLAWDQSSYSFGDLTVGAFGDLTATLSNAGGVPASTVQVSIAGTAFSRVGGSCSLSAFTLAGGGSCTVVLRFAPAAGGAASGSLNAAGDGGVSAQANLNGSGLAAGTLTFNPSVLAFGNVPIGGSATLSSTLGNSGGSAVADISLAVAGTGFSRSGGTCADVAFSLAAGATCTVSVRFDPAAAGAVNGQLNASSAQGGASAALSANATPLPSGAVGFSPPLGLDFGDVLLGASASQSILVTNTGNGTLTGMLITAEGPFALASGTCPANLAPAATCSVSIQFQPAVAGAVSGLLRVVAEGGINTTAGLTGSGISGLIRAPITVPSLDRFGLLVLLLALAGAGGWALRRSI